MINKTKLSKLKPFRSYTLADLEFLHECVNNNEDVFLHDGSLATLEKKLPIHHLVKYIKEVYGNPRFYTNPPEILILLKIGRFNFDITKYDRFTKTNNQIKLITQIKGSTNMEKHKHPILSKKAVETLSTLNKVFDEDKITFSLKK